MSRRMTAVGLKSPHKSVEVIHSRSHHYGEAQSIILWLWLLLVI